MTGLPEEVRAVLDGRPTIGELDQAFPLLTVDADGTVDVCLLSRTEVEPGGAGLRMVVAGRRVRRNLRASGRATFLAVAGNAAHVLTLEVRRLVDGDGALAAELAVVHATRDDAGVELVPLRFRAEERLVFEERWDRTAALLERLASGGEPA